MNPTTIYFHRFRICSGAEGYLRTAGAEVLAAAIRARHLVEQRYRSQTIVSLTTSRCKFNGADHPTLELDTIVVTKRGFPLDMGLLVQAEQLRRWRELLCDACYAALEAEVEARNASLDRAHATGRDVWGGDAMLSFVINWKAD